VENVAFGLVDEVGWGEAVGADVAPCSKTPEEKKKNIGAVFDGFEGVFMVLFYGKSQCYGLRLWK
jgi:hypothetical protein